MKARFTCLVIVLVCLEACSCSQGPFIGKDDVYGLMETLGPKAFDYFLAYVSNKPYDPGAFAWSWQYQARACLLMYELTHERRWLDWALNMTDYFARYSDVNGDGEPAWGNYNGTWGSSLYEYREYTVWDGVIGLPIIEAAKVIRSDPALGRDSGLLAKADSYVNLITRLIARHHKSWAQVKEGQGYYWDDPLKDVGPIVNRFAALGRVELTLGDVTGNLSYYDKPQQMASYLLANIAYDKANDLYTWTYAIGQAGAEDISHGAIELQFLLMANERGLVDDQHIRRLCNTYRKKIWQLPRLLEGKHIVAMRVDGDDPPGSANDYTLISRSWVQLSRLDPIIYDCQRTAFGVMHERYGLGASGVVMLALSQIALSARELESMGVDLDEVRAVDLQLLDSMLLQATLRLNDTKALGAEARTASLRLDEASAYINEESLANASVPIGLIWQSWDMLGNIIKVGQALQKLSRDMTEAEGIGAGVAELKLNLSAIQADFRQAETDAALGRISARIGNMTVAVQRVVAQALIDQATQVLAAARELGINTSRHEIFLQRAREEFNKGNYGSARLFTNYPLSLRSELVEFGPSAFCILAIIVPCLARKKPCHFYGARSSRSAKRSRADSEDRG